MVVNFFQPVVAGSTNGGVCRSQSKVVMDDSTRCVDINITSFCESMMECVVVWGVTPKASSAFLDASSRKKTAIDTSSTCFGVSFPPPEHSASLNTLHLGNNAIKS